MITRQRVLEILADHDTGSNDPTSTLDGEWCDDSTFDLEVGIHPNYKLMDVLSWLGYCCPFC